MHTRGGDTTGVAQRTVCSAQEMAVAMGGGGSSLVHGHGYWRLGSATGYGRWCEQGCASGGVAQSGRAQWKRRAQLLSAAAL